MSWLTAEVAGGKKKSYANPLGFEPTTLSLLMGTLSLRYGIGCRMRSYSGNASSLVIN